MTIPYTAILDVALTLEDEPAGSIAFGEVAMGLAEDYGVRLDKDGLDALAMMIEVLAHAE